MAGWVDVDALLLLFLCLGAAMSHNREVSPDVRTYVRLCANRLPGPHTKLVDPAWPIVSA